MWTDKHHGRHRRVVNTFLPTHCSAALLSSKWNFCIFLLLLLDTFFAFFFSCCLTRFPEILYSLILLFNSIWPRVRTIGGPGPVSRYSDTLWTERSRDGIPVGVRFPVTIQTCPGTHPTSCIKSFPGIRWPERDVDHPPPPSAFWAFVACLGWPLLYRTYCWTPYSAPYQVPHPLVFSSASWIYCSNHEAVYSKVIYDRSSCWEL